MLESAGREFRGPDYPEIINQTWKENLKMSELFVLRRAEHKNASPNTHLIRAFT